MSPSQSQDSPTNLELVKPTDVQQSVSDPKAEQEKNVFARRREAELTSFLQDVDERKKYASRTFWLICAWLAGVFLILLLNGFGGINKFQFHLEQAVLLAILGSTTINILGIFIVVMHYLFPHHTKTLVKSSETSLLLPTEIKTSKTKRRKKTEQE